MQGIVISLVAAMACRFMQARHAGWHHQVPLLLITYVINLPTQPGASTTEDRLL
jgi:hypothetical protein